MISEAIGVMLVLLLGGRVVPILLLLAAAVFDVFLLGWEVLRTGIGFVRPRVSQLAHWKVVRPRFATRLHW